MGEWEVGATVEGRGAQEGPGHPWWVGGYRGLGHLWRAGGTGGWGIYGGQGSIKGRGTHEGLRGSGEIGASGEGRGAQSTHGEAEGH